MSRVCWLVTYHTNKTMGKECCSRLSRLFVGRDELRAPIQTLAWEAGEEGMFWHFYFDPIMDEMYWGYFLF